VYPNANANANATTAYNYCRWSKPTSAVVADIPVAFIPKVVVVIMMLG
jgi:hypothetical protein